MQLQAIERVEAQDKELWRLSTLLVEHQAFLKSLPERPHQEPFQAPPVNLSQHRHGVEKYLPSTVNTNRGVALKTGQVPDLGGLPIIKRETFQDILADAEVPTTPQRRVQFADMATSTPIILERPMKCLVEQTPQVGASQVSMYNPGPFIHP